jgi:hypothetical protein
MALSQDEQRMLAEIERRLAADDPGLASCLTTFRRPGPGTVLRSPRARIIGTLFTVLLVAMISLMVYAMVPFRPHTPRHSPPETSSAPVRTAVSAATTADPARTQQSSAGVTVKSTASQGTQLHLPTATAAGRTQQAEVKPANEAMFPQVSP